MTSTRLEHQSEDEMMDKVVGKGVSVVQLPGHQRPWKTQTYAVRFGVLKQVVDKLNGGTPTVDAFANYENARFSRYWGLGGCAENSWDQDWGKERLLWCNPPYSDLARVFEKIQQDKAKAIVVVPDWRDQEWSAKMWAITKKSYRFPAGSLVFELPGKEVPPTKWGVWAVLVDGGLKQQSTEKQQWQQQEWKMTRSTRRRQRRTHQE